MNSARCDRFDSYDEDISPSFWVRFAMGAAATLVALIILCATSAHAFDTSAGMGNKTSESRAGLSLVDFTLPLGFITRFNGSYSRVRRVVDEMAFDRWTAPGPAIKQFSFIESRLSVGRRVASGVELEVAWESQNSVSVSSVPSPERQRVGVFIRLFH